MCSTGMLLIQVIKSSFISREEFKTNEACGLAAEYPLCRCKSHQVHPETLFYRGDFCFLGKLWCSLNLFHSVFTVSSIAVKSFSNNRIIEKDFASMLRSLQFPFPQRAIFAFCVDQMLSTLQEKMDSL